MYFWYLYKLQDGSNDTAVIIVNIIQYNLQYNSCNLNAVIYQNDYPPVSGDRGEGMVHVIERKINCTNRLKDKNHMFF